MADKKVIEIPIDSSKFDEFVDRWNHFNAQLEHSGDAWATTNKGIRQQKDAFNDAEKAFASLVRSSTSEKFSSPTNGVFARISKDSKETGKSWTLISKEIERSGRNLSGLMRDGARFSSLFSMLGLGGIGTLALGAFSATVAANSSLADQNILNRKLGLKPGEERAFDTVYEKAGGDSALLGKVATAKSTPSQWRYLQAAGVPQQDIMSKDPAELSAEFLQKVGEKVRQLGPNQFGMWAQSMGVTNFADVNTLRQAGSYSTQDFAGMAQQFGELTPKLAAQQKVLDEATKAHQDFSAALEQDELELSKAFIRLNPLMVDAAQKVTDFIAAFAESGELDQTITNLKTGFEVLATGLGKLEAVIDWLVDKESPLTTQSEQMGNAVLDFYKDAKAGNWSKAWDDLNRPITDEPANGGKTSTVSGFASTNNPGNVKNTKGGGFMQYPTPEAGVRGADDNMRAYWEKYGINTLNGIITRWAPSSENDTDSYIKYVSKRVGIDPTKPIDMTDQKKRAQVESAMFAFEGRKGFKNLTADQILAIEQGKSLPDVIRSPFNDPKEVAKVKSADALNTDPIGGFPVVPYDEPSSARPGSNRPGSTRPGVARDGIDTVMTNLRNLFADTFGEGGGAALRSNDRTQQRIDRQGNQPYSPYNINIRVSAPAGSSTIVSTGSIAQ